MDLVRHAQKVREQLLLEQRKAASDLDRLLITAGIFSFLFAWSDFVMALTLTTGESIRPITLGLYNYIGTNDTDWSSVMAAAVISSIPAVVMLIAAQRYIAAGATGGAVK